MASAFDTNIPEFRDSQGPIIRGKLFVGTFGNDPFDTYQTVDLFSDEGLTQPITNPLDIDLDGRVGKFFLAPSTYSYGVTDASGNPVPEYTELQVTGIADSSTANQSIVNGELINNRVRVLLGDRLTSVDIDPESERNPALASVAEVESGVLPSARLFSPELIKQAVENHGLSTNEIQTEIEKRTFATLAAAQEITDLELNQVLTIEGIGQVKVVPYNAASVFVKTLDNTFDLEPLNKEDISLAIFGDDISKLQDVLAWSENGTVRLTANANYVHTSFINTPQGTKVDLNGATVDFNLATQIPAFNVIGDDVEICNGTINVVGAMMGGAGNSLAPITIGDQGTGAGYKNFHFHDLTLSTNRNDAGGTISVLGECSNGIIENITIPDNANCRNIIGIEWGGTPGGGTGHPHNIVVRNINIGRLTYPTYGASGYGYAVWASAAFNIQIENITMEEGYGLVMAIRGDNANTYAPDSYKNRVGTGIEISNCSISNCYGYGLSIIGSHTNGVLDNIPMNAQVKNISINGKKVGANNNFAIRFDQCRDAVVEGFSISGSFAAGVVTSGKTEGVVIQNGTISDCELYGASIGTGSIRPTINNVKFVRNNSLLGSGTGTSAVVIDNCIDPSVSNCNFGEDGVVETQKYSIFAGATSVRPRINNNHTYSVAAAGVAYLINSSTTPEINATGINNTGDPSITNIVGGAPIFRISHNGKREFDATAIPTAGQYNQGDTLYFTSPIAAGSIGATCVTSGTPGTWKNFGVIDA